MGCTGREREPVHAAHPRSRRRHRPLARRHQLDVLSGIGDTRRERVIGERRKELFTDFADLATRVDSLHNPQALLVERVLTELEEVEEARYKLLVN